MLTFATSNNITTHLEQKSRLTKQAQRIMAKSLSEQVSEIKNGRMAKSAKVIELLKLGITRDEITIILGNDAGAYIPATSKKFTVTFGVEMETYNVDRSLIQRIGAENGLPLEYQGYNHHDSNSVFKFVTDGSIRNAQGYSDSGCIECVTPVLKGRNGLASLKKACATLNAAGAKVNRTTGLHVHIGAKDLTGEQYVSVFVNYQMLETLIDTFMAGSRRANNNTYCESIIGKRLANCHTQEDVCNAFGNDRYFKVNACSWSRHRTIEFRQHQGSTDYEKISNWISFCAKLVVWSRDNRLTRPIASIDEIPFLTNDEKAYFKRRQREFARQAQ